MNADEARQMGQVAWGLCTLAAFAWFYASGGRDEKAERRWWASFLFTINCCLIANSAWTFSWWMPLGALSYAGSLSMGYGGDTTWRKLWRRGLYGLALGAASAPFLWPLSAWELWGFQIVLAVVASVFLGLRNPVPAPAEEALIALLSTCGVPFALIR